MGQSQQLMTKTDAKSWNLICSQKTQLSNDILCFCRVPRTIGQHKGVWFLSKDVFTRAGCWHTNDGRSAFEQLALDVVFGTKVPKHHAWAVIGRWGYFDRFGCNRWHCVGNGEFFEAIHDGFFWISSEHSVHYAVFTNALGQSAGVDAVEADHAFAL